jgi:hypothetical protein
MVGFYFIVTETELLQKAPAVCCSNDTWRYLLRYFCCVSALGLPTKTLCTFRFSSMLATCPARRILPDLTTLLVI